MGPCKEFGARAKKTRMDKLHGEGRGAYAYIECPQKIAQLCLWYVSGNLDHF